MTGAALAAAFVVGAALVAAAGLGTQETEAELAAPDPLRFVVLDTGRTRMAWSPVSRADGYAYSTTAGGGVTDDTSVVLPLRALGVGCVRARRTSPPGASSDSACARVAAGPETRIRFEADSLLLFPGASRSSSGSRLGLEWAVALYRDSARSEMIGCQGSGCWRLVDRLRPAVFDVRGRGYYMTWPDSTASESWVLRRMSDVDLVPGGLVLGRG